MEQVRRYQPSIIPAAIGVLLVALGQSGRGFVLLGIAVFVLLLVVLGVDVAGRIVRLVAGVVAVVSALLAWALWLVLLVPMWVFNAVVHRDPLRPAAEPRGWQASSTSGDDRVDATFSVEPTGARLGVVHSLAVVVGVLGLAVLADLGLGVAWNRATGEGDVASQGALRINSVLFDPGRPPDTAREMPPDARADGPAMSPYPWREEYFQELASVQGAYWPYTLYRSRSFRGEHVNISGWRRRSYQPVVAAEAAVPSIAFFGGSALFGEGQRDEHTIPSQIARLAEADGLPVRVDNFGQRGWVLWQEMVLYEQLLAAGEQFDLSVFYDGANDLAVQTQPNSGVPTHFDVEEYAQRLSGPSGTVEEADVDGQIGEWWRRRSLVYRSVSWLDDQISPEVGASDAPDEDDTVGYEQRGVDVYQRSRDLTRHLSDTHGVEDIYYWQPQSVDVPEYRWAAEAVAPVTIDLSRTLGGHAETFLDFVHTNEEGARVVAEAMWTTLEPRVRAWYESQR